MIAIDFVYVTFLPTTEPPADTLKPGDEVCWEVCWQGEIVHILFGRFVSYLDGYTSQIHFNGRPMAVVEIDIMDGAILRHIPRHWLKRVEAKAEAKREEIKVREVPCIGGPLNHVVATIPSWADLGHKHFMPDGGYYVLQSDDTMKYFKPQPETGKDGALKLKIPSAAEFSGKR